MKKGFNDNLADRLYLDFCEAEGGVNHPVLESWCKCEEVFGEITFGHPNECIDELFHQTIKYVIDALEIGDDWDDLKKQVQSRFEKQFVDSASKLLPPETLQAIVQDAKFQIKDGGN